MTYTVVLLREADGRYAALIPAVDVASWGHSVPEALRMVEEAFGLYVEAVRDEGGSIPADPPQAQLRVGDATEALVYKVEIPDSPQDETHAILRNPDTGRIAVVPMHGGEEDLPPSVLCAILRQADLTVEEFTKLLE